MKILILADEFPPQSFGGAGISTFDLSRGLVRAGQQVVVVTTCQKKNEEREFESAGMKIFRIFTDFHERWEPYLSLYNPKTVGKVREIIKEINPDIIHAHNIHSFLSYYCLKIAKKSGKPVFLTARDTMLFTYGKLATKRYLGKLDPRVSWVDNLRESQKRYNPFRNIIIRHYLKYVDKIFAISDSLKQALELNKIKNVEVIYNGIDVDEWQMGSKIAGGFKDKEIVFFAGRISNLKGAELINQAMDLVKKDVPEAVLLVAGTRGVGWLAGDNLKAAYYAADIVVIPSVYLDPFNRTNIEAMACKKPVVGTCFGGTPEIVKDGVTGYIVNPLNVGLMAQKITDLLKNPTKAKQFGEAGYERVKKDFSLEKCVQKNLDWYQKYLRE
ncbi:MAG: glycosyltransferase family 4 protein [Candidatus Omnitrophica bacterium]|nr:glycosyltransferase family 4 protein [Candidatus Omnitrophota bacterium]